MIKKLIQEIKIFENLSFEGYSVLSSEQKRQFIIDNIDNIFLYMHDFQNDIFNQDNVLDSIEKRILDQENFLDLKKQLLKKIKIAEKSFKLSFVDNFLEKIDDNFLNDFQSKHHRSQYLKEYLIEHNPFEKKVYEHIEPPDYLLNQKVDFFNLQEFPSKLNQYFQYKINHFLTSESIDSYELLSFYRMVNEKMAVTDLQDIWIQTQNLLDSHFPERENFQNTLFSLKDCEKMTDYQINHIPNFLNINNFIQAINYKNDLFIEKFAESKPQYQFFYHDKEILLVRDKKDNKIKLIDKNDMNDSFIQMNVSHENKKFIFYANLFKDKNLDYDFFEYIQTDEHIIDYKKFNPQQVEKFSQHINSYEYATFIFIKTLKEIMNKDNHLGYALDEEKFVLDCFCSIEQMKINNTIEIKLIDNYLTDLKIDFQNMTFPEKMMVINENISNDFNLSLFYQNENKLSKKNTLSLFENHLLLKYLIINQDVSKLKKL